MADSIIAEAVALTAQRKSDPLAVYPETPEALGGWIETVTGQRIPAKPVCPDHDAPFQFVSDFFFNDVAEALVLAPRAGGKTFETAALHLANNYHKPGFEVSHIGAIETQAKRCYTYYGAGLRHPSLRAKAPSPHIRDTIWTNGSRIEILPGTEAQTQGGHPHLATYDELEQGKRQPYENAKSMPVEWTDARGRHRGQFLATSTRQTSLGLMQRALDEAAENGTRIYEWCLGADTSVETEHGPRPIQEVRSGDRVYSWHEGRWGLYPVAWSGYTGTKRTLVITLSNGREIRATEDHEFRTVDGWQRAGHLTAGVSLLGLHQAPQAAEAERRSQAQDHSLQAVLAGRGVSPPAAPSMRMRGGYTAPLETLRRLLPQGDSGAEPVAGIISRREARGEVMALSSVKGGAASYGAIRRTGRGSEGPGAIRHTRGGLCDAGETIGYRGLRGLLARDGYGEGEGCTAQAHPRVRGLHTSCAARLRDAPVVAADTECVEVIAIREHGLEPVYDLTVPGAHSFVAEGVVVHNCVFETMEPCDGKEGRPDCDKEACPLWKWCEGRAVNADGWRSRDEIIGLYNRVGIDTWEAQHLCIKPDAKALIYAPFSRANVTEEAEYVPGVGHLWVAYDWGFTDPTHIALIQEDDGIFYQFDELTGSNRSEREWVREIVKRFVALEGYEGPTFEEWEAIWLGRKPWPQPWPEAWPEAAGDPSAVQFRAELKEHGIGAAPAAKVKHNVEEGQDVLRAALLAGSDLRRYLVHPRCLLTIRAFSNYRARELADGSFDPRPDPDPANHAFSHGCDAARYLMWRLRRTLGITSGGSDDHDN